MVSLLGISLFRKPVATTTRVHTEYQGKGGTARLKVHVFLSTASVPILPTPVENWGRKDLGFVLSSKP